MDTPPPACSSPDLAGRDERGLRGSVGLCVAPCCDLISTISTKNPVSPQPYGGGGQLEQQHNPLPPPGWPVGASPRRAWLARFLHHWRGISFVPRAALSAGRLLGRRRFLLGFGGAFCLPLCDGCGLGPNWLSGRLQAEAARRYHCRYDRRTGCIPASGSRGYFPGRSGTIPPA